ncbi:MAG: DUF481 domain-containing protein [Blastocatellales bacterium]|nr:DUF481 domain-containing protein [Blastocatellales bacterium]
MQKNSSCITVYSFIYSGIFTAFLCLIIGTGTAARADQIVLKNGDRITGTIVKADGASLVIKSEYAGVITVKADAVDQISADQQLYLTLNDGRTVVGALVVREGRAEVSPKDAPQVSVARDAVTVIRSESEHLAYERMQRPGWLELWNGFADFGYNLTTGNTRTNTIALGTNLARETRRDKTTLYAAIINSNNTSDGVSVTTANAIRGGGRYEISLTSRLSTFSFADFEYNEIQLLDLRSVIGGGLGYDVIKNDRARLQAFGGGSWNHENFSTGITRNSGELIAGQDLSLRVNDRVTLKERLQFFPNLSDTGEYRITFDAGVSTKLTSFLDWQITVSDRYLSNPVGGAKKNDLLLTTGLRVNFRR